MFFLIGRYCFSIIFIKRCSIWISGHELHMLCVFIFVDLYIFMRLKNCQVWIISKFISLLLQLKQKPLMNTVIHIFLRRWFLRLSIIFSLSSIAISVSFCVYLNFKTSKPIVKSDHTAYVRFFPVLLPYLHFHWRLVDYSVVLVSGVQ